jgi:transcription elongation GreA/GreB family factor
VSRAFVKEPDGERPAEDIPERVPSPHTNYVTPAGLRQLHERFNALAARRAALLSAADQREARELRLVERDMRYLSRRIESAVPVDPSAQPGGTVCFGSTVTVEDDGGRRRTVTIVGEDEAAAERGKISWVSPLARCLLEARVGDTVTWSRPAGDTDLLIVAVRNSH